jgi:hypothetical protein
MSTFILKQVILIYILKIDVKITCFVNPIKNACKNNRLKLKKFPYIQLKRKLCPMRNHKKRKQKMWITPPHDSLGRNHN